MPRSRLATTTPRSSAASFVGSSVRPHGTGHAKREFRRSVRSAACSGIVSPLSAADARIASMNARVFACTERAGERRAGRGKASSPIAGAAARASLSSRILGRQRTGSGPALGRRRRRWSRVQPEGLDVSARDSGRELLGFGHGFTIGCASISRFAKLRPSALSRARPSRSEGANRVARFSLGAVGRP